MASLAGRRRLERRARSGRGISAPADAARNALAAGPIASYIVLSPSCGLAALDNSGDAGVERVRELLTASTPVDARRRLRTAGKRCRTGVRSRRRPN